MCFVFIWEQTATCVTYSINWLVFISQMKIVYSAVRTGPLNKSVRACLYLVKVYWKVSVFVAGPHTSTYFCKRTIHLQNAHKCYITEYLSPFIFVDRHQLIKILPSCSERSVSTYKTKNLYCFRLLACVQDVYFLNSPRV